MYNVHYVKFIFLFICSDLFVLPARISQCKHVREFFKPRPSDLQDDSLPLQKMTSLLGIIKYVHYAIVHVIACVSSIVLIVLTHKCTCTCTYKCICVYLFLL